MTEAVQYKKKDFASDQDVKWCPGCGDYAILSALQLALTKAGKKREDIVCVSGIGCSSRFPYYMGTYGMHTIHGRAPAFVSGIKCANPDLTVWMITGDGDGLSIGGNHLIHILRRNFDVNILLFNNEIYGLTKGQYSPTSKQGLVTKSTPYGSVDRSFNPGELVMGAGSTFIAKTLDTDPKHMQEIMLAADQHKGASFVEVYQNCVIFNDKVHEDYTNRKTRDDFAVFVKHGEPLVFGKEVKKGVKLNGFNLELVELKDDNDTEGLIVHDKHNKNLASLLLAANENPEMPKFIGVLYQAEAPSYESQLHDQLDAVKEKKGEPDFNKLLNSGDTWTVS